MFTPEVIEEIKYYVYRLIDPRNGETFYVGKGHGNRVFAHVKEEIKSDEDEESEKIQRIKEIRLSGFEVAHIIHRHGMDEKTALEVEAALIDAYPSATNISGGKSSERGVMHSKQIIELYRANEIDFQHKVLMITVNNSASERENIYEAVRYAWKLDPQKAKKAELVLAMRYGLVEGVFIPEKWLYATPENFEGRPLREGRWGFIGREAPKQIKEIYYRKRIPKDMCKKGAANPIRYKL